jgi:RNA polymerase sigma-70 factor (ECF subfamily)
MRHPLTSSRIGLSARHSTGPRPAAEIAVNFDKPLPWTGRPTATAAAGDFEPAVAPHYAPLVRRLALVLGDEAEAQDVAQEAYLQAFRSWSRFDGADVRGWLYTIGLRLAFNELRRRRRRLMAIGRLQARPWHDSIDPDLAAALQSLEPRARAAFLLSMVDGYTQPEIAAMMSVPLGTVASWISRARGRLRATLERP